LSGCRKLLVMMMRVKRRIECRLCVLLEIHSSPNQENYQ
jgi:hypothetical protein